MHKNGEQFPVVSVEFNFFSDKFFILIEFHHRKHIQKKSAVIFAVYRIYSTVYFFCEWLISGKALIGENEAKEGAGTYFTWA